MYLESLEIQGFKSFPDKIKLDFNKGMTAVVGPNGSGKSNIGDAVRWVLGEQSSKTLRGDKMEDVIFSGTACRKPVGFAAVTLNIVNNQKLLNIPSERVAVTRKLYRNGDSEYLINGTQVRLKQVYELFMDTGLGRDGYAIIGQGRIAEIVSAKSKDRREIFDEAAGISKFRYQKANAERELSKAEDNIVRLRDILSELEARIGPLKIQSDKAAKYIEYAETRKVLEITVWINQIDEYKSQLEKISDDILINTNEYNALEADVFRLEESVDELSEEMEKRKILVEMLNEEVLETTKANTGLYSDIAVFENEIQHSKDAIEDIRKQQELSKNSGNENKELIEQKLINVSDTEKSISDTQSEYLKTNEMLCNLQNEQNDFDSGFSEINNALNKLYIKQSEFNTIISASERNTVDINEQLKLANEQDENIRTSLEELKQEKSEISDGFSEIGEKINELTNRIGGLSKLHAGRAEKLAAYEKEITDTGFAVRDKEQRIKMLLDMEKSMQGVSDAAKYIINASKSGRINGVFGSVAQLVKVESKYSLAIEIALGAAMNNVVVANDDTAKRCISMLKEAKVGTATFLPITNIKGKALNETGLEQCDGFIAVAAEIVSFEPEYKDIFTSFLGRIVIAEDLNSANMIAKKYGFRFKICTLDGQVINAGGSFTGGFNRKSTGILTRKNDIETLSSERTLLNEKIKEFVIKRDRAKAETDKLYFEIEGAKDELNTVNSDKIKFESEAKRIELMITQAENQLIASANSFSSLKKRLEDNKKSILEASEMLDVCIVQIAENEKAIALNEEKRTALHNEREMLSEKMSALKIREIELLKDKEALVAEIKSLEKQCESIGDNSAKLLIMLDEQQNIIEKNAKLIEERKASLSNSGGKVLELKEKIYSEQQKNRSAEQKSNEQRVQIRELTGSKEKYSREITRLESRKESVQKSYDGVISNMSEQYNIYPSEASLIAKPVDNLLQIQSELNDVKQKIRGLGNINLEAIEEYKEVSQRYSIMSADFNDAENSKQGLEGIIAEYTEKMKVLFSESFSLINENFKSIFMELFGGGNAGLTLTEPDNILESGIEIHIAPPGKVVKTLSLLSGGEQAFVAIAIYFAILKIKPSPFCILDEIEAALDDINVSKYAQYLRNFTDTTQFIVVTHRRGTMDEADVLYGVTMQEKGISRVLRLDQPPPDLN